VVTNYLLKPFSYPLERLLKMLGQVSINILFVSPIAVLLGFLLKDYITLPSLPHFFQFVGLVTVSLIFYFLIYFLTAMSSFWVTHGGNFIYATIIISNFLNGSVLPLDLFPEWYQAISIYLPFQYLIFVPIQAYLGNITNWPLTIILAFAWMAVFILLNWVVWRLGVKKFEAVGR
jgi:ABC-2 type transport system permease protein